MNSRIPGIEETDLLIMVGVNPKLEAPVFNARIKKAKEMNGFQIGLIGSASNLTYNYTHLGNST